MPYCPKCDVTGLIWTSNGRIPIGPCSCRRGRRLKEERKKGLDPINKPYCFWCKDAGFFPGKQFCNCPEGNKFQQERRKKEMQTFDTGATRDNDDDKLDYDGFLSPLVIRRYAEYLHKHRTQADGKKRDSDNWQKGIPIVTYMKSMWRHFVDLWTLHREIPVKDRRDGHDIFKEEALCAIIFNASGYLHELLKDTNYIQYVGRGTNYIQYDGLPNNITP